MGCTCKRASSSQKICVCTSLLKPEHVCLSDYLIGNINHRIEMAYNSFCGHKYVGIYLAGANCQTLKIMGPFIYQVLRHAWATWELARVQPSCSSAEVCHIFCLPSCAEGTGLQHLNRESWSWPFFQTQTSQTQSCFQKMSSFFFLLLHTDSYR